MPYSGLKALRMPPDPMALLRSRYIPRDGRPLASAVFRRSGRKLLAQLGPSRSAPLLAVKLSQTNDAKGSP